ncbi:hypothetical protein LSAT2_013427, partial [Lamellibrachia satsuma]
KSLLETLDIYTSKTLPQAHLEHIDTCTSKALHQALLETLDTFASNTLPQVHLETLNTFTSNTLPQTLLETLDTFTLKRLPQALLETLHTVTRTLKSLNGELQGKESIAPAVLTQLKHIAIVHPTERQRSELPLRRAVNNYTTAASFREQYCILPKARKESYSCEEQNTAK